MARSRLVRIAYPPLLALYFGGLLLWLVLGMIPYLAAASPAVRDVLTHWSAGHGPFAAEAGRAVGMRAMLASGPDVVVQYLFSLINLALGLLLAVRRFHDTVARMLTLALFGTAATFNSPSHLAFHVVESDTLVSFIHFTFHTVSGVAYVWAVVLFPNGRLPWRGGAVVARRIVMVVGTAAITAVCWQSDFIAHPPFFVVFFGIFVSLVGMVAQTARLNRPAAVEVRQQARLLRAALLPGLIAALAWLGTVPARLGGGEAGAGAEQWETRIQGWFPAVFVVVPLMLFLAIVRYRLWDLDVAISRTLLYGSLTTAVSAVYIAGVVLAGHALGNGPASAVAVMVAVGLMVAPLRDRLHRITNRIVFGQTMSPAEAMRQLADGLERLAPVDELRELTRVAVAATRAATSARLWLVADDLLLPFVQWPAADRTALADRTSAADRASDSDRTNGPQPIELPDPVTPEALVAAVAKPMDHAIVLSHRDKSLGVLVVTARQDPGLTADEERLLDDLAGHAGLMVHNAQLAAELRRHVERLAEQTTELRRSRQRLVTTQDAERRRLEHDIHDGAQQDLVAARIKLCAIQAEGAGGTAPRDAELDELRELIRATGRTLRELCGSGLPRALLDGGLDSALAAAAASAQHSGLQVVSEVDSPTWVPLNTEAAVYFCCNEALQNAAKHANAHRITLTVSVMGTNLEFTVIDDGIGFDSRTAASSSGLAHMNERLAAFGGELTVIARPGHGTCVRGRVPVVVPAGPARSAVPALTAARAVVPSGPAESRR